MPTLNSDPASSARLPLATLVRLLRIMALLWIGYFLTLIAIDRIFVTLQPSVAPLPLRYYLWQSLIALGVLGLTVWPRAPVGLGRWFLPLVIGWMAVLPTLLVPLLIGRLPPGPITSAEGLGLRLLPVLFMALVLVGWQYHWRHVVFFSLGLAALSLPQIVIQTPPNAPVLSPGTLVTLIQTISFLMIGSCIAALMQRLRAQSAALEQANAQLRHFASTQEQLTLSRERNRVARELHDTLAHTLSGLTVHLETTRAYWAVDQAAAKALLDTALDTARSGLQETRRALKALRASPLEDLGLLLALRRMLATAMERSSLQLELALPDDLPALAPDVEQCLYRIAQEAVANVIQHAAAHRLTFQLASDGAGLTLLIRDDGGGFDQRQPARSGHFGLPGMHERAQLAGGQLRITSQPGQGTTVQLTI
jgi:signal transduction histidine kinase